MSKKILMAKNAKENNSTTSTETAATILSLDSNELMESKQPVETAFTILSFDDTNQLVESTQPAETAFTILSFNTNQLVESTQPAETATSGEGTETIATPNLVEIAEATEPMCKKAKLTETVDRFIENMVKSNKALRAILSEEFYKPITFAKFYVGQVKQVKQLSNIILTLNKNVPLKEFSHLKRACRKEVLLFPTHYINPQTHASIQYYLEKNCNEIRNSFEYFKIIDVPAVAPKVRKQYVECGRSWSCNFHPDKYLEKIFNDELFTLEEIKHHRIFMGMAFEVARYFLSQKKPDLEVSDILQADINATIIVDPNDQSVVAVAFDNRDNHPVQHSVMLAIDNVAKTQNGGVWRASNEDIYSENLQGLGSMELILHLKKKYPAVKFGAKDYISKKDLERLNLSASECPYLCTEYYVYVIREPCLMCSMALVHARANRVFFYKSHEKGALITKTKLHCVSSLNHRYEVFTDFE